MIARSRESLRGFSTSGLSTAYGPKTAGTLFHHHREKRDLSGTAGAAAQGCLEAEDEAHGYDGALGEGMYLAQREMNEISYNTWIQSSLKPLSLEDCLTLCTSAST